MRPDPIIVMGAPRSGTTYVNTIINQHPLAAVSHETRIFVWAHLTATEALDHPRKFLSYKPEFRDHLGEELPALIRSFYEALSPGAVYWGDKNPHYASPRHWGLLPAINDWFPGAKFVHVLRDGRDVVASLVRKQFPDGRPWIDFAGAHETWNSHVMVADHFGETVADDTYLELRYEDLVADDLATATRLFEFLEIPLHRAVTDFCIEQQRERTPFSQPASDLTNVNTSDWSSVFDDDQQRDSMTRLLPNLRRFGYVSETGSS